MKVVKIVVIVVLVYAGVVAVFESLLGYFQPEDQNTLTITTRDDDGTRHERVLSRLVSDDRLYVAANHWPRAWYRQALENPDVLVAMDGETAAYRVVPVTGEEFERVDSEHSLGPVIRFLTGFPPRRLVRLDPMQEDAVIGSAEPAADPAAPAADP